MRSREGGFTLIEIMVSMALLVIGLMGILALQMTTVKGNRMSRELERAKVFAGQMMEDLRGRTMDSSFATVAFPDVTTPDGTKYMRSYTVAPVSGSSTLFMITTTVRFYEDGDPNDEHSATLQMMRTQPESI